MSHRLQHDSANKRWVATSWLLTSENHRLAGKDDDIHRESKATGRHRRPLTPPRRPDSPLTPLSSSPSLLPLPTPPSTTAPKARKKEHLKSELMRPEDVSVWLRWAVSPASALRLLLLPVLLAVPTHFLLQAYMPPPQRTWTLDLACLGLEGWTWSGLPLNPFTPFFTLSHPAPPPPHGAAFSAATTDQWISRGGQLYIKGPLDLALLAWTIVVVPPPRLHPAHLPLDRPPGRHQQTCFLVWGILWRRWISDQRPTVNPSTDIMKVWLFGKLQKIWF
ncbi:hypothetical protein C8F04DRAFT_1341703 [Mycena alexandri]|uniref:Uncharacterized protein n=1 Tax=Mycena alexandri TaxID=1745969 RepID=A0AAD6SXB6_9AGAR|nr:hypothetical protein C8F04DRAFT_1341703 [Mycena alexandri]